MALRAESLAVMDTLATVTLRMVEGELLQTRYIGRVDLNLLVYLDALLRERNVTRAADLLGLSQPAMSNGLRRLRDLFEDPLLVRTSDGMAPTERAEELEPVVRDAISLAEPIAPLCRPDCPGLCETCGLDLTDDPAHEHPDDDIDPRLAALAGLRDQLN